MLASLIALSRGASHGASHEAQVMIAPRAAYERLVRQQPPPSLAVLLRRPARAALVIGGAIALASTGGATLPTLVTTTLCWSFVPAVQLIVAAVLIALCRRPGVRLVPALDLFFAAQGPWLLWMLGVAAAALLAARLGHHTLPRLRYVLAFALVPLIWTGVIIFAFCQVVLGLDKRPALGWMLLYEAAIWGIASLYVGGMTFQVWPFGRLPL
jgi:hypothetical protein